MGERGRELKDMEDRIVKFEFELKKYVTSSLLDKIDKYPYS